MERPPVEVDFNGSRHVFHADNTTVRLYRRESHLNHVEVVMNPNQTLRVFNAPQLCMYLAGIQIIDENTSEEEVEAITTAMYETVGWNVKTTLEDRPPHNVAGQIIRDRFASTVSMDMQQEQTFVPEGWIDG